MAASAELIETLLVHRSRLLGFIRKRLDDPSMAEDVLQDALLRALRSGPDLQNETALVPWFYRILHNAIIDLYRRRRVDERRFAQWELENAHTAEPTEQEHGELCECFRALLPALKDEYAQLIRELDLGSKDAAAVAAELGISRNNLKVRHHRARTALRQRLEETCRTCAVHGCLDCTCGQS